MCSMRSSHSSYNCQYFDRHRFFFNISAFFYTEKKNISSGGDSTAPYIVIYCAIYTYKGIYVWMGTILKLWTISWDYAQMHIHIFCVWHFRYVIGSYKSDLTSRLGTMLSSFQWLVSSLPPGLHNCKCNCFITYLWNTTFLTRKHFLTSTVLHYSLHSHSVLALISSTPTWTIEET